MREEYSSIFLDNHHFYYDTSYSLLIERKIPIKWITCLSTGSLMIIWKPSTFSRHFSPPTHFLRTLIDGETRSKTLSVPCTTSFSYSVPCPSSPGFRSENALSSEQAAKDYVRFIIEDPKISRPSSQIHWGLTWSDKKGREPIRFSNLFSLLAS